MIGPKYNIAYGLLFIVIAITAYSKVEAQQYDNKLWTSLTLDQRINKDIVVSLEQSLRLNNGWSQSEQTFTQIGLKKIFNKNIRAEFNYRFVQRENFTDADNIDHRFNIDLAFRKKYGDFRISFRSRYQKRYRNINSSEDGDVAINYNRNRLTAKYSLYKDVTIGVGAEVFYKIYYGQNQFDRYRLNTFHAHRLSPARLFPVLRNSLRCTGDNGLPLGCVAHIRI